MPCSSLDVGPDSEPPPLAPKTVRSATLATLAAFWSSEPATFGSHTWIVPQPLPTFGRSQLVTWGMFWKQTARPA